MLGAEDLTDGLRGRLLDAVFNRILMVWLISAQTQRYMWSAVHVNSSSRYDWRGCKRSASTKIVDSDGSPRKMVIFDARR